MRSRVAPAVLWVVLPGCTSLNPAYSGEASATDIAASTSAAESGVGTAGSTRGSTTQATGGGRSTTSGSAEDSSSTTHAAETDAAPQFDLGPTKQGTNWLWVTNPLLGDWGAMKSNPCVPALAKTDATCANEPVPIAGRSDVPLAAMPQTWGFLSEAPFYGAVSGELVLNNFEDLLERRVEPGFVHGLTNPENPQLYTWRGPIDDADLDAPHCLDWTNLEPNGAASYFEANETAVGPAVAPCVSQVALLCACAAAD